MYENRTQEQVAQDNKELCRLCHAVFTTEDGQKVYELLKKSANTDYHINPAVQSEQMIFTAAMRQGMLVMLEMIRLKIVDHVAITMEEKKAQAILNLNMEQ